MRFDFKPEEFIVEEITQDGVVLELDKKFDLGNAEDASLERDYFTRFVLQKREWNTMNALAEIARRLHVKQSRFDFAGTKDRNAITTQLCSAFAIQPERLLSVRVKDVQINGAWKAREKVKLGNLQGNRFTITITKENCGVDADAQRILAKAQSHDFLFPNFFGQQRFGSLRGNSHLVGKLLLKQDLCEAAMVFIAGEGTGEKEKDSVDARKQLRETQDFTAALESFPRYLKYERLMLEHLAQNSNDFAGAFQKLPRTLSLMFIHAFQSFLFNEMLAERLKENREWSEEEQGMLIGSESTLGEKEEKILEREGLEKEEFKMRALSFLSSKGGLRPFFARLKNFELIEENPVRLRFLLDSGCYATTALEFLLA